jgi:hypothetical protein
MGKAEVLTERMVIFDGLTMKFRNVRIRGKLPTCCVCGPEPKITDVAKFDYDDFCQTNCDLLAQI